MLMSIVVGNVVAVASQALPTATPVPGGGETLKMTQLLASVTEVFESVMQWTSTVATTVMENPLYLLGCVLGIACIGIGVFKRLLNV